MNLVIKVEKPRNFHVAFQSAKSDALRKVSIFFVGFRFRYTPTDTPVTMAVKSHIRNGFPAVLCIATNDALAGSAKNIGAILNNRSYYFVPFRQDDNKTLGRIQLYFGYILESGLVHNIRV